jgi:hypothetical protein
MLKQVAQSVTFAFRYLNARPSLLDQLSEPLLFELIIELPLFKEDYQPQKGVGELSDDMNVGSSLVSPFDVLEVLACASCKR